MTCKMTFLFVEEAKYKEICFSRSVMKFEVNLGFFRGEGTGVNQKITKHPAFLSFFFITVDLSKYGLYDTTPKK